MGLAPKIREENTEKKSGTFLLLQQYFRTFAKLMFTNSVEHFKILLVKLWGLRIWLITISVITRKHYTNIGYLV